MRKIAIPIILAAFLLAACSNSTPVAKIPTDSGQAPTEPPRISTATLPATMAASPVDSVTKTPMTIKPGDMMPGCTVVSVKPTTAPPESSIFGAITEQDWVMGPPTATVTLLEYSDFQ